ncbi:hypothetical protein BGW42_006393, partial [Actinomortierella wolfii]
GRCQKSQKLEDSDNDGSIADTDLPLFDTEKLLREKLALQIFGERPLKYEFAAVDYLVSLTASPSPKLNTEDYLAYLQAACPTTPKNSVERAWVTMKEYFIDAEKPGSSLGDIINVASFVEAFKEVSELLPFDSSAPAESIPAQRTSMPPPPRPSLSRSSRVAPNRTRSNSTSSNGNSYSNPTPAQALCMNKLFKDHFDSFHGSSWSLPSGTVVDDRLREVIEGLPYESTLHSFIIEDVNALLQLFDDPADRGEIERVLVTRPGEGLPALSPAEHSFLEQYIMPPDELYEFLMDHGCRHVGNVLQEKPSKEFQFKVHNCITHILSVYHENNFAFPMDASEAWFTSHLWGFLRLALSSRQSLLYKPGEVTSEASARRRNKRRTMDGRQICGHKVDGMVVMTTLSLEICYMEAGKNDGGANTTKCLHDTRKLCKLMKDAHDAIRERAIQDAGKQLATFGLRISGPTITIFTLRQRPGRFYQAVSEVTASLPVAWVDQDETRLIIAIIAWIFRLQKAISAMTGSTKGWALEVLKPSSGSHEWAAPTMTSPCLLGTSVASADVPPLVL